MDLSAKLDEAIDELLLCKTNSSPFWPSIISSREEGWGTSDGFGWLEGFVLISREVSAVITLVLPLSIIVGNRMCRLVLGAENKGLILRVLHFIEATHYSMYHSYFQYTKVRAKERKQKKCLLCQFAKKVNVSWSSVSIWTRSTGWKLCKEHCHNWLISKEKCWKMKVNLFIFLFLIILYLKHPFFFL